MSPINDPRTHSPRRTADDVSQPVFDPHFSKQSHNAKMCRVRIKIYETLVLVRDQTDEIRLQNNEPHRDLRRSSRPPVMAACTECGMRSFDTKVSAIPLCNGSVLRLLPGGASAIAKAGAMKIWWAPVEAGSVRNVFRHKTVRLQQCRKERWKYALTRLPGP